MPTKPKKPKKFAMQGTPKPRKQLDPIQHRISTAHGILSKLRMMHTVRGSK